MGLRARARAHALRGTRGLVYDTRLSLRRQSHLACFPVITTRAHADANADYLSNMHPYRERSAEVLLFSLSLIFFFFFKLVNPASTTARVTSKSSRRYRRSSEVIGKKLCRIRNCNTKSNFDGEKCIDSFVYLFMFCIIE